MDRFTGVSGTQLASHTPDFGPAWTLLSSGAARLTLDGVGGIMATAAAPTDGILYDLAAPMATADYSALAVLERLTATATVVGVAVRITAANSYYAGVYSTAAGRWKVIKNVAGVISDVATTLGTFNAGEQHQLLLTVTGTTLQLFVDGILTVNTTDASLAGPGAAGVISFAAAGEAIGTGMHIAQWQAFS